MIGRYFFVTLAVIAYGALCALSFILDAAKDSLGDYIKRRGKPLPDGEGDE